MKSVKAQWWDEFRQYVMFYNKEYNREQATKAVELRKAGATPLAAASTLFADPDHTSNSK